MRNITVIIIWIISFGCSYAQTAEPDTVEITDIDYLNNYDLDNSCINNKINYMERNPSPYYYGDGITLIADSTYIMDSLKNCSNMTPDRAIIRASIGGGFCVNAEFRIFIIEKFKKAIIHITTVSYYHPESHTSRSLLITTNSLVTFPLLIENLNDYSIEFIRTKRYDEGFDDCW